MKNFKNETISSEYLDSIVCDKCGYIDKNSRYNSEFLFKCEIKFTEMNYPECANGTRASFDLCVDCAKEFIEDLPKIGITPIETDWDC